MSKFLAQAVKVAAVTRAQAAGAQHRGNFLYTTIHYSHSEQVTE